MRTGNRDLERQIRILIGVGQLSLFAVNDVRLDLAFSVKELLACKPDGSCASFIIPTFDVVGVSEK